MNSIISILFIFLFSGSWVPSSWAFSAFTQQNSTVKLSGTVLDIETQKPIAYVSVGVLNEVAGTISGATGTFTLSISDDHRNKTLRISAIGYEARELRIQELLTGNTNALEIALKAQPVELAEVKVKANQWKKKKLGGSAGPITFVHHNFTAFQRPIKESLGREVGVVITNGDKQTFLSKLNFCISSSQFDELTFRVNIYAVKDGQPAENLVPKEILTTVNNLKRGWVQVDLEPYNLYVSQDFIIALEWVDGTPLEDSKSLTLAASLPGFHTTFYKDASQSKWEKMSAVGVGLNVEVQRAN